VQTPTTFSASMVSSISLSLQRRLHLDAHLPASPCDSVTAAAVAAARGQVS